ncbi:hypothetical protein [Paenibacillus protaetiae]|uniref:DUF3888 domain-containing protein n=1 Tax=Paenibacillus protaetiae TaxID=2509456 RepID=A0A4P6F296_9BACL|nr:hypothetical protein [Paenibacillus protaetiae]QAY67197.1 hypothetical protein ET464_13095 [Paenibacillus protaetiae]
MRVTKLSARGAALLAIVMMLWLVPLTAAANSAEAEHPARPSEDSRDALLAALLAPDIQRALSIIFTDAYIQYDQTAVIRVRRLYAPDIDDWPSSAEGGGLYFELIIAVTKYNGDAPPERLTLKLNNARDGRTYGLISYKSEPLKSASQ